jgi:hypothetical protein
MLACWGINRVEGSVDDGSRVSHEIGLPASALVPFGISSVSSRDPNFGWNLTPQIEKVVKQLYHDSGTHLVYHCL